MFLNMSELSPGNMGAATGIGPKLMGPTTDEGRRRLRYPFLVEMTASEASFALLLFVAGVTTLACSIVSAVHGLAWQAAAFGAGGMYVVVWSGLRLIPAEAGRR
jgi:hypothetical protein